MSRRRRYLSGGLEGDAVFFGEGEQRFRGLFRQQRQIDGFSGERPMVGATEQQQCLGELDRPSVHLDGQSIPPLTTDENRWLRLVFDDPEQATYQRMNGELVPARAHSRPDGRLELAATTDPTDDRPPFATLTPERPTPDHLLLRGILHDRPVTITLERKDPNTFTLLSRGFHWIQDYPYFR